MTRKTTRYFETPEEAVRVAKARAQQTYVSKYVGKAEEGFFVSTEEPQGAVLKVTFNGTVVTLTKRVMTVEELQTENRWLRCLIDKIRETLTSFDPDGDDALYDREDAVNKVILLIGDGEPPEKELGL